MISLHVNRAPPSSRCLVLLPCSRRLGWRVGLGTGQGQSGAVGAGCQRQLTAQVNLEIEPALLCSDWDHLLTGRFSDFADLFVETVRVKVFDLLGT